MPRRTAPHHLVHPVSRLVALALALACAAALALGAPRQARADSPTGPSGAGPSYVENGYQDPVTALPPVSRPGTAHCTVTVMEHDFADTINDPPYLTTVTPPAQCPGPWTKVVMDWSGSVAGRQYDRLAGVWLGGAEILRTSTPEPDADGVHWSVAKDISAFTPLLRTPQPVTVSLANVVDSTYTGVYRMKLTFTYYQADRRHPAAAHADQVVPLSRDGARTGSEAGWYSVGKGGSASTAVTLPRNLTSARLEVYARGGGCDEQWFTAVPDDLAARYPDFLCGGGPYREVQVAVDGRPAGLAQPYPVVYSGGIVPTLWRPIPAVDQFLTLPYDIDLTPFVGLLVDGRPHTIALTPYGAADEWILDGTLFLDTDHRAARTSGALTADTLTATPRVTTAETPSGDGSSTDVQVTTRRDWRTEGYVDTSRGRITTRVEQHSAYRSSDTVSAGGQHQVVAQRDSGATTVTVRGGGRNGSAVRHAWSYPIDVDVAIPTYVDGNTYDLRATVTQGRVLLDSARDGGDWRTIAVTDDTVASQGVLARSAGTVTAADGSAEERYLGTTDTRRCQDRTIRAEHGWLTADTRARCSRAAAARAAAADLRRTSAD